MSEMAGFWYDVIWFDSKVVCFLCSNFANCRTLLSNDTL